MQTTTKPSQKTTALRDFTKDAGMEVPVVTAPRRPQPGTFFANCAVWFERAGFTLVRTDWRDGPIHYYVVRHGRARGPYGLSELAAMMWVIGEPR